MHGYRQLSLCSLAASQDLNKGEIPSALFKHVGGEYANTFILNCLKDHFVLLNLY